MDLKTAGAIASKILQVAETVAPLVETAASFTPIGAAVVTGIKIATAVGTGLFNNAPEMEALYDQLVAAKNGGTPITAAQWAEWDAAADQAHSDLQAACAA